MISFYRRIFNGVTQSAPGVFADGATIVPLRSPSRSSTLGRRSASTGRRSFSATRWRAA
jgi:hypothetical protein